uniref:Uncharacterized protein n=1 Tax=Zea mays TaxID=4577 RepID=A0A804NN32_MAIZE
MSSGGGRKAAGPGGEEAEVEALIRAAQDAVLLKLKADEVDKVMRWAMDAARLDVAAAGSGGQATKRADGDEEEEEKDEKSSVSSEDEDEDERLQVEMARKKDMAKTKTKSKNKWFFL